MKTIYGAGIEARHGLFLIMISAIMWGTVGVTTKTIYGLGDTTPLSIGFFRLVLATPTLLLGSWFILRQSLFQTSGRDLALMLLVGAMTALYQVCYFSAIQDIGVAVTTLITLCTAPVIVAILSAGIMREWPTSRVILALVCALAGTMMLIKIQDEAQSGVIRGVFLALTSALGYAIVTLCSRVLAKRYHPLHPLAISFGFGALLLLPFALATGFVVNYSPAGWALLLYLGLVPTALAYGLFLKGMQYTTATVASIVTLLEPLTSAVLAWFIFGERFSSLGLFGVVFLFGAIALLYGVEQPS
jgi:DME family drug/metabolite transporter